jgi:uncharacterized membrane protein
MQYLPLLPCLIYVAIGIPMVMKLIPPNSIYGYRTPRTLNDETVWYTVNANTGLAFIICGVICAVTVLAISRSDLNPSLQSMVGTAIIVFGAIIPIAVGALS